MKKKCHLGLILCVCVALVLVLVLLAGRHEPARSQTATADSLLQEAASLTADSLYEEAMQKLDAVVQQYPGTQFDVEARLAKAYILGAAYRDDAQAKEIYNSLAHLDHLDPRGP